MSDFVVIEHAYTITIIKNVERVENLELICLELACEKSWLSKQKTEICFVLYIFSLDCGMGSLLANYNSCIVTGVA